MIVDVQGRPAYAYTGGRTFDPTRPVVVLVHGAQHDHSVWALQSRFLAHHGRSVLAVDLPGHGRSAGPPLSTVEAMADWIVALLAAVGARHASIVGHSMGSLIALETAARCARRDDREALMDGRARPDDADPVAPTAGGHEAVAAAAIGADRSAARVDGGRDAAAAEDRGADRLREADRPTAGDGRPTTANARVDGRDAAGSGALEAPGAAARRADVPSRVAAGLGADTGPFGCTIDAIALIATAYPMQVSDALLVATRDDEARAIDMISLWSVDAAHGGYSQKPSAPGPGFSVMVGGRRLMQRQPRGTLHNDFVACNAYRDGDAAAASVRCPALFVLGANDAMTPAKSGRALAARIAAARVVALPDIGHFVMAEAPDATLDALDAFLPRTVAASTAATPREHRMSTAPAPGRPATPKEAASVEPGLQSGADMTPTERGAGASTAAWASPPRQPAEPAERPQATESGTSAEPRKRPQQQDLTPPETHQRDPDGIT